MRTIAAEIKENIAEYKRHQLEYITLFLLGGIMTLLLCLPACAAVGRFIMVKAGIPYLSNNTILLFVKHPVALVLLAGLLALMVILAFLQYAFLLLGLRAIRNDRFFLPDIVKETVDLLRCFQWKSFGWLALYIILILPLAGSMFENSMFAKVKVPNFIEDYLLNRLQFAIPYMVLGILEIYISLRYIFVIPLVVLKRMPMRKAFQESARMTRGHKLGLIGRIVLVNMFFGLVKEIIYIAMVIVQYVADSFGDTVGLFSVIIVLSLARILSGLYSIRVQMLLMMSVLPREMLEDPDGMAAKEDKRVHLRRAVTGLLLSLTALGFSVFAAYHYVDYNTLVISHRGVDGENGVQNTIPALIATVGSAHPDFVEIDLHETRDGQFVLMHDENLKTLCGVDAIPHDLTLEEITTLEASENGFQASVPSFDEYLETANGLGQKLLIELKTTKYDTPDMVERFVEQYGENILEHGHRIHSLDLAVIDRIKGCGEFREHHKPLLVNGEELFASCILPLNIIYPETNASAYTVEMTNLNEHFLNQGKIRGQEVYVWTVNDISSMDTMILMDVDGIITDYPSLLNQELESIHNAGFSVLITKYLSNMNAGVEGILHR